MRFDGIGHGVVAVFAMLEPLARNLLILLQDVNFLLKGVLIWRFLGPPLRQHQALLSN